MFYLFAIGSMIAYAVQNTLLVHHARKIDGLSLAFYRNASFILTLSPLLLFSSSADILTVLGHWKLLVIAGITGGISLGFLFAAYKFLSTGFTSAIVIALSTISTTSLGWLYLGEEIPIAHGLLITMILAGVLFFGLTYKRLPHLDSRMLLGMLIAAANGPMVAISKYCVTILAREADPLVTGYFWETSIAVCCFVLLILRGIFFKKPIQHISRKLFGVISLCAAPTLLGTGLFALTVKDGPIAIVGAIGCGSLIVATFLAHLWYAEHIHPKQWIAILLILGGIAGLKIW